MMYATFAQVLNSARIIKGFTSDEALADEIGMSWRCLQKLRHAQNNPSFATLAALHKIVPGAVLAFVVHQQSETIGAQSKRWLSKLRRLDRLQLPASVQVAS